MQILISGDAFYVALRRENSPAKIRGSVSRRRNANFDIRRRVLCGPAQGKQSFRIFHAGETQILTCRDAFFVALRRRNTNLTSRDKSCIHIRWISQGGTTRWTKTATALQRDAKKFSQPNFNLRSRVFCGPAEQIENLYRDLRGFIPTVKTPQYTTLFRKIYKIIIYIFFFSFFNIYIITKV